MLLAFAGIDNDRVSFIYDDCAEFDPATCSEPVEVQSEWICRADRELWDTAKFVDEFLIYRAAIVEYRDFFFDRTLASYTGQAQVKVYLDGGYEDPFDVAFQSHLDVYDDLFRVQESTPSGDFPRAALPRHLLRRVRHLSAVYERLGSFRAVKRRKPRFRRFDVGSALVLRKALRRLAPYDRFKCPKRYEDRSVAMPTPRGNLPAPAPGRPPARVGLHLVR